MILTLTSILLIIAFICFICDAFNVGSGSPKRPNLTSLGLAFWVLAQLLQYFHR